MKQIKLILKCSLLFFILSCDSDDSDEINKLSNEPNEQSENPNTEELTNNDEQNDIPNNILTITKSSLIGTWNGTRLFDNDIGKAHDKNSSNNTCENKPDYRDVVNELLFAYTTKDKFLFKETDTRLGEYEYDIDVITNSNNSVIINCDFKGKQLINNNDVKNEIFAFQFNILNLRIEENIITYSLNNGRDQITELRFIDEKSIDVYTYSSKDKTPIYFASFVKINEAVDLDKFSKYLLN